DINFLNLYVKSNSKKNQKQIPAQNHTGMTVSQNHTGMTVSQNRTGMTVSQNDAKMTFFNMKFPLA
ncbi:MAG: hypothetical protein M0R46_15870, partial [Candidatus Muirbacterium halophilum]|nr:hypothetical protein [Candidatus Muirbacterium halophilum]